MTAARRLATRLTTAVRPAPLVRGFGTNSTHSSELAAIASGTEYSTKEIPMVKCTTDEKTGAPKFTHEIQTVNHPLPTPATKIRETVRRAFALEKDVAETLTPTLKRFTLEGKVAVVTGGARGLGYNMAMTLAEVGIKSIAILDVQQDIGVRAALDLHSSTGIPTSFYKVDVRSHEAVAQAIASVVQDFGSIDILINSAGIADSNITALNYTPEQFTNLLTVNLLGSFLVAQSCARHMIAQRKTGSIIFIASMSGHIVNYPQPQCAYNASKAAVIHLSKSLAAEWAQYGIRVNSISPGYMDTELNRTPALEAQKTIWRSRTPLGRLGGVEELGGVVVALASEAGGFVTGGDWVVDGGYCVY